MEIINQNKSKDDYERYVKTLKEKKIFTQSVSNSIIIVIILWLLTKKDYHGYYIMKKLDELFDIQINAGLSNKTQSNKIYPLLKKLEENDLIESYEGTHNKKTVKFYKITESGLELHTFNKIIINKFLKNELLNEFKNELETY